MVPILHPLKSQSSSFLAMRPIPYLPDILDSSPGPQSTSQHTRSFWQLVYSCAATIFACIWVSVHPNVPGRRDSGWERLRARLTLMLIALIAPEMIVLFAMRQRRIAVKICEGEHCHPYCSCTSFSKPTAYSPSADPPGEPFSRERILHYCYKCFMGPIVRLLSSLRHFFSE
jgi:hypothetical protein